MSKIKNYDKYLSLSGMKTRYWGPNAWNFLFCSILGTYPEKIDNKNKNHIKIKKEFKNLFSSLCFILPCIFCRESYTNFIKEISIDEHLHGRIELCNWLYKLKDKVNKKLIKQENKFFEHFNDDTDTILNLVMYDSNNEHDKQMKNELEKHYNNNVNIVTYFVTYSETIKEIKLESNIIYLPKDTNNRIILSLEYCVNVLKINFKFVVISGINTIINFNNLKDQFKYFYDNNIGYASSHVMNLQWLDHNNGIHDNTHFNTLYAAKSNIILNKKNVKYLLHNKDKLDKEIIDDIAIGILFKNYEKPYQIEKDMIWIDNEINKQELKSTIVFPA